VLDPFAGSGATLAENKNLARRFMGIELDRSYADVARASPLPAPPPPARLPPPRMPALRPRIEYTAPGFSR
jgi:hypothetical protein